MALDMPQACVKLLVAGFSLLATASSNEIHTLMTSDEIRSVFGTDAGSVPDYEIVPIRQKPPSTSDRHGRTRRSYAPDLELTVSGKELRLYLEENGHVLFGKDTPVFAALNDADSPLRIKYKLLRDVWPDSLRAYHDPANKAALTIETAQDGRMSIDGLIAYDTVIKPIPEKLRSYLGDLGEDFMNHHFVYKLKDFKIAEAIDVLESNDYSYWGRRLSDGWLDNKITQKPKKKLDFVYPEILVIVDHETYRAHGNDPKALARYMAAFWNAVDLRFRELSNPKVRLNIAGLIIPVEKGAAYYLNKHRVGKRMLEHSQTFNDLSRYLRVEDRFKFNRIDLTVAITNFDMCTRRHGYCDPSIRGIAFVGGACKHEADENDLAVTLIEDNANFDGIVVAAHEIGHLLGAPHDGDAAPRYVGGPGARGCDWDDGYLMSSARDSARGMHWSDCSLDAIAYFLNNDAYCLRNKPAMARPSPKYLPGKLLSRQQQCNVLGMVACEISGEECGQLWCRSPHGFARRCVSGGAPAEGSSCSGGRICLNGFCVGERADSAEVVDSGENELRDDMWY